MSFIADLHIHSRYSRATSRDMTPENLWKWSQLKGISVIGTGDFTHPAWLAELREKLEPAGNGLFTLKPENADRKDLPQSCAADVFFMLTAEISCIYRKQGRTRKVHCLVFAPDFKGAEKIQQKLASIGNITADGRPILGLDAKELLKLVLDLSPGAMLVPAHAWTPHFSVFGAASGFDSLEECFDELAPHVPAIETGLSSDPPMNSRISALDRIRLISNSDAHSPLKLGREANVFDTEITYAAMMNAIVTGKGFAGTIEFFPEEGKYHYDGHRDCGIRLTPDETRQLGGRCPACGKKITIGVMHRVTDLADRAAGGLSGPVRNFRSLIPLHEILAEVMKKGVASKAVNSAYHALLTELGNELDILLNVPCDIIGRTVLPHVAEAVSRVRAGKVYIEPGYDGEYGTIGIL